MMRTDEDLCKEIVYMHDHRPSDLTTLRYEGFLRTVRADSVQIAMKAMAMGRELQKAEDAHKIFKNFNGPLAYKDEP